MTTGEGSHTIPIDGIYERYGFKSVVICTHCLSLICSYGQLKILDDDQKVSTLDLNLECCNHPFTLGVTYIRGSIRAIASGMAPNGGLRNDKGHLMIMGLEYVREGTQDDE